MFVRHHWGIIPRLWHKLNCDSCFQPLAKQAWLFLRNTVPIMHCYTGRFVGPLGRLAFSPQGNRSRVRLRCGRGQLVRVISDRLYWCGSERDCRVHVCLNKPNQGWKTHQVPEQTLQTSQVWKCPDWVKFPFMSVSRSGWWCLPNDINVNGCRFRSLTNKPEVTGEEEETPFLVDPEPDPKGIPDSDYKSLVCRCRRVDTQYGVCLQDAQNEQHVESSRDTEVCKFYECFHKLLATKIKHGTFKFMCDLQPWLYMASGLCVRDAVCFLWNYRKWVN